MQRCAHPRSNQCKGSEECRFPLVPACSLSLGRVPGKHTCQLLSALGPHHVSSRLDRDSFLTAHFMSRPPPSLGFLSSEILSAAKALEANSWCPVVGKTSTPQTVMPPMCLQGNSIREGSHPSTFPSRAPHHGINDVFVKRAVHLTNTEALSKLV